MELKKIQVENYKSVHDSEPFEVDRVTCLVGKNEAGKTSILQALYKLNPVTTEHSNFDAVEEYPRSELGEYEAAQKVSPIPDNVLTTVWELDEDDCQSVEGLLGPDALTDNTVKITKGYSNVRNWTISLDESRVLSHILDSANLYKEECEQFAQAENIADLRALLTEIGKGRELSPNEERLDALLTGVQNDPLKAARQILGKRLPKFLYFGEYYRLKGRISVERFLENLSKDQLDEGERLFAALVDQANANPADLANTGTLETLIARLESVSNRVTREIFSFWSQNRNLTVEFRLDAARPDDPPPFDEGYVFQTRIRNTRHMVSVNFDERSTGFVWFFSFLVWFSQVRRLHGSNVVILLDEPGLGLHAKSSRRSA